MAEGRKTGGRTKGTPNRSTADVVARLAELGCDPIEGMALIALDETNPPELRGKMFAELAGYVAPKRKAIEHLTEGSTLMGVVMIPAKAMPDPKVIWEPTDKQSEYLSAGEDEVLYGGAAGGGKTDALVIDALGLWQQAPLVARYRALLIRRSFLQLREVIDRTRALYPLIVPGATYYERDREWRFPSGAKVVFGYLERDADCEQYQGQEYQFIAFEELTQWPTAYAWSYLRTRLRGTQLKKLMRATCNPGGIGSSWVQDHWRIPDDGSPTAHEQTLDIEGEAVTVKRRFIPARVTDNPHLPAAYRANLMLQTETIRKALLEGRWDVMEIPGAIYKKELDEARDAGRLTSVPYDPSVPVYVSWDLGIGDSTALWCAQLVGREIHLIDYYEASGEALPHYFAWLERKPYRYAEDLFPHDAQARELGTGRTREELARANGRKVRIVPRLDVEDGINAVRLGLARTWIDAERCKRGLECLMHYRREWNDKMGEFKPTPVHDWASHGSDSLRYLFVGLREQAKPKLLKPATAPRLTVIRGGSAWMA